MANPCCVYDITIRASDTTVEYLKEAFRTHCKKWAFQREQSESGYDHYQCRVSFKTKHRRSAAKEAIGVDTAHFSVTSKANQTTNFYVIKTDTRTEGPWKDDDREVYVPRQYRGIVERFYPWQQQIWDQLENFEPRVIHVVVDPKGNQGKSTLASLAELMRNGYDIPPENDGLKLIQSTCNMLMGRQDRTPGPIFIDLPKSMDQSQLYGTYKAIEQIKKGKVYDLRNHYKDWWFDSPQVWVFCNQAPDPRYLIADRWRIHTIEDRVLTGL